MPHNNVGLKTAKGSSTSGHIQRSLASHNGSNQNYNKRNKRVQKTQTQEHQVHKPKDNKLIHHLQRREIELQVSELRDELEEGSDNDETIERKCNELREKLVNSRRTNYSSRKDREQNVTQE